MLCSIFSSVASYNASNNELSISSSYSSSATFEWAKCGETTIHSTDETFESSESGDYQVTVTDGACVQVSPCVTVQLNDNSNITSYDWSDFKVYPNPSNGIVFIQGENLSSATLTIVDLSGKGVYSKVLEANSNELQLNSLNKGVYFVNIKTEKRSQTKKLILK